MSRSGTRSVVAVGASAVIVAMPSAGVTANDGELDDVLGNGTVATEPVSSQTSATDHDQSSLVVDELPGLKHTNQTLRFREIFGLATDLDSLTAAEMSVVADTARETVGVALTGAELAAVRRQVTVQNALQDKQDEIRALTGVIDFTIDHRSGGLVTVFIVAGSQIDVLDIESLLPTGSEVRIVENQRTAAELDAMIASVFTAEAKLEATGTTITALGYALERDGIFVGVERSSESIIRQLEEIVDPEALTIWESGEYKHESRTNPPYTTLTGGLGIRREALSAPPHLCTLNQYVTYLDTLYVMTAGHCFDSTGGGGGLLVDWEVNDANGAFGQSTYNSFVNKSEADVGLLTVNNGYKHLTNCVYETDTNCITPGSPVAPIAGGAMWMSGATSGNQYGIVVNPSFITNAAGTWILNIGKGDYVSAPGDSGAPITALEFVGEPPDWTINYRFNGVHEGIWSVDGVTPTPYKTFSTWDGIQNEFAGISYGW